MQLMSRKRRSWLANSQESPLAGAVMPGLAGMSFERLVARQAGVVSLAQAIAAGMSPDTVQRRVREGRWTRLHPRIYLVGGHRPTPEARIRAAWLWAGLDSV